MYAYIKIHIHAYINYIFIYIHIYIYPYIYVCNLFPLLGQLKRPKSKDTPVKINIPRCLNI